LTKNAPERRVRFDFDELAANRRMRNGFYWAKDIHSNGLAWSKKLLYLLAFGQLATMLKSNYGHEEASPCHL